MKISDYYTTAEASQVLNRDKPIIINWIRKGRFSGAVKQGWIWLIPKSEVDAIKTQEG